MTVTKVFRTRAEGEGRLHGDRRGESSLSQGITTEVVGSCGWAMAPVKEETRNSVLKGLLSGLVHREAYESLDWSWHSFGQFIDALESGGIGTNAAPQVGQSLIRAHVVGTEKRDAAPGEIDAMKALVRQAMEDGAWEMSTGRSYRPGGFAPAAEIVELAKVVAGFGGIYATHMKDEGDDLFGAVQHRQVPWSRCFRARSGPSCGDEGRALKPCQALRARRRSSPRSATRPPSRN